MLNGINDLELECIENAICVEDVTPFSQYIKLNIPKLMPMINVNKPDNRNKIINRNILLNASGTIPTIDLKIDTSNYIQLPINTNRIILKGESVLVLIPNKNIKKMKIINI